MPSSRRCIGVTADRVSSAAARRLTTTGRAGWSVGQSAVVLLALGLTLSGCSSDDKGTAPQGSEPVAWVGTFCNGLGDVIAGVSKITKSAPTPQGQKDGLLAFSDTAQQAFTNTAGKLEQLGPPRIADGKQVHDAAVNFFTTAAGTVGGQRAKLAELDANDPEFLQKASQLAGPDLTAASTQMKDLTRNQELAPAFGAAPECRELGTTTGP
ncbi:MAG: hypothetical protein ACRDRG_03285 [Pseudonocardiaceae bacterium]